MIHIHLYISVYSVLVVGVAFYFAALCRVGVGVDLGIQVCRDMMDLRSIAATKLKEARKKQKKEEEEKVKYHRRHQQH